MGQIYDVWSSRLSLHYTSPHLTSKVPFDKILGGYLERGGGERNGRCVTQNPKLKNSATFLSLFHGLLAGLSAKSGHTDPEKRQDNWPVMQVQFCGAIVGQSG